MKNKILFGVLFGVTFGYSNYTTPDIAYKSALENSSSIKSVKLQYDSKVENIQEVYAKLYPNLSLDVSYSKSDYEINELQIRTDYDIKETSLDYKINLNQTIYDHSIYSQLNVENTRLKLHKIDYESKKQDLISDVLDLYMKILDSNNKLDLLETNLSFNIQTFNLMQEKYKMNLVSKMDYLEADVDLQKTRISFIKEKKNRENLIQELKDLTKLENVNIPSINLNLFDTDFVSKLNDLVKKEKSLENNLMILQAKTAVEMSNYDINTARSGHYPTLSFNASYTKYVSDDVTTDYENYGKAILKLDIPLYKGGSVSSRVKSKILIKKAALEDLLDTQDKEKSKLNEISNELSYSLNSLNIYKEALNSAETYLKSIELAHEKGLRSIVDLYEAKTKLYNIKYEYIKSISDLTNSFVAFLMVTNNLEKLDLLSSVIVENK